MNTIIPISKYYSLGCKITDIACNYQDLFDSAELCFLSVKEEVIKDCKDKGYFESEICVILEHYKSKIESESGEWKNVYLS